MAGISGTFISVSPLVHFMPDCIKVAKTSGSPLRLKHLILLKLNWRECSKIIITAWKISASLKGGNSTLGQLSEVHLREVDNQTDIKQSSKGYRHDCVKRLFTIFPELKSLRPTPSKRNRIAESFCRSDRTLRQQRQSTAHWIAHGQSSNWHSTEDLS